jgi:hypothetical protein
MKAKKDRILKQTFSIRESVKKRLQKAYDKKETAQGMSAFIGNLIVLGLLVDAKLDRQSAAEVDALAEKLAAGNGVTEARQ